MVSRKDWVIFDLVRGDLFRITIVKHSGARGRKSRRRNTTWYLTKYVNFSGLDLVQIEEALTREHVSMLEASKEVKDYSYIIAHYDFHEKDMNFNYWKGMLGRKGKKLVNTKIENVHIPVNKKRLEDELYRLCDPNGN